MKGEDGKKRMTETGKRSDKRGKPVPARKKGGLFSSGRRRKRGLSEEEIRAGLRRTNREIMGISYVFLGLFILTIVYLAVLVYRDGDSYRNNSNNTRRLAALEDKYTRGNIVAADGTILATTTVYEDGEEKRQYPMGAAFSHVVGYTVNGVTGLESAGASYLLNNHTNPLVRIVEALRGIKSSGDTVVTTLDVALQQIAYEELGGYKGAVVAMDPSTGKILAMASRPGFNPNTLADDWQELVSDSSNSNLVNRATQGKYTPGSTFKLLTFLEYMREYPNSWQNFSFTCDGVYEVDDYSIRCSHGTEHGLEDVARAFARSCNGAFASIGQQISFRRLYELCGNIGFNSTPDTSVPMAASTFTLDNNNSVWAILQTAIGQGETQITPLFNCMIAAGVANGGMMMNPYLIDSVVSRYNDRVESFSPKEWKRLMSEEEAGQLAAMMRQVVTDGTGTEADGYGFTAYGKTGSAEVRSDLDTNAWFIGYAEDDENPGRKLAVSIIVEQGGSGGTVAAPIAERMFQSYFNR